MGFPIGVFLPLSRRKKVQKRGQKWADFCSGSAEKVIKKSSFLCASSCGHKIYLATKKAGSLNKIPEMKTVFCVTVLLSRVCFGCTSSVTICGLFPCSSAHSKGHAARPRWKRPDLTDSSFMLEGFSPQESRQLFFLHSSCCWYETPHI